MGLWYFCFNRTAGRFIHSSVKLLRVVEDLLKTYVNILLTKTRLAFQRLLHVITIDVYRLQPRINYFFFSNPQPLTIAGFVYSKNNRYFFSLPLVSLWTFVIFIFYCIFLIFLLFLSTIFCMFRLATFFASQVIFRISATCNLHRLLRLRHYYTYNSVKYIDRVVVDFFQTTSLSFSSNNFLFY